MNSLIHKSNTLLGRLVIAALLLIVAIVISVANVTHADNGVKNQSGRILTIHDRGTTKVVVTEAANISDALKEAGFVIDNNDVVEPAVTEKLVASNYQVNIYRARPVIIVDGNSRTKVITAYQTAEQIAQSVGIKLYSEDKTILGVTDNIIADGAGLQLTIIRSTPFELTLYGKTTIVRTQAKTIATMLTEKGIKLSSDDRVSLGLDTSITDGLAVRIWREGKQTITVDEPVNFEVEKIKDADREVGYVDVRTAGVAGSRSASYEITIQDGVEVNRTEIASITTLQPVKQIEVVGVKVRYIDNAEKTELLRAAGIAESDWGYVDYIISHESNWNPNSINSNSGACGLAQALPCSKVPGDPLDPINSLKWADSYAHTCVSYRMYCGWEGAYNFWVKNKWW